MSDNSIVNLRWVTWLSAVGFLTYSFFFVDSLRGWFHAGWSTDDALQQTYLFFDAIDPDRFRGDLISDVMRGYLAPLHYWTGYLITVLTRDPIMTGHWIMLLQLGSLIIFLFLLVRKLSCTAFGFLAITWLLHTRASVQRLTGGLPRGWAPVILVAVLYFASARQHRAVMVMLMIGCLLHPPATFMAGFFYGVFLIGNYLFSDRRQEYKKPLLALIFLTPLYLVTVLMVVWRPEEIGQMVSGAEALLMPQFLRPDGRFPFLPLLSPLTELKTFGFEPFISHLGGGFVYSAKFLRPLVVVFFVLLVLFGIFRKRNSLSMEVWIYLGSIAAVYFLSRWMIFRLYVPNRHLQIPLTVFWIVAFLVLIWRVFFAPSHNSDLRRSRRVLEVSGLSALTVLALLVIWGSGNGLSGDANFNASTTRRGNVFLWLRDNTPPESLIAGHPTFVDDSMLVAQRRALATTETYHPFYPGYLSQIEPRIEASFRAHYAKSLSEIVDLMIPYDVDYFVFDRHRFYPEALESERYFEPLRGIVERLSSSQPESYAYKTLPRELDPELAPYLIFRDHRSAVIDMKALQKFLERGV